MPVSGGAQVVADGGEQRRAEPVDFGEFAGVGGLGGQALGFEGAGCCGGEPFEEPPVLGEELRAPADKA
jgi:hypothetical protein